MKSIKKTITLFTVIVLTLLVSCTNLEKEVEYTIYLSSYYDESVHEALLDDITSRVNATYLDFETGEIIENEFSDLYYVLSCGMHECFPVIKPLNDARAFIFGNEKPKQLDCLRLIDEDGLNNIPGVSIVPGNYSCIQTAENNVGWIRFDKDFRSGMDEGVVQLTYWLWNDK